MATQEYFLALGENRWAFASADYELVFLIMTMDASFQQQIDTPKSRKDVITSKSLGRHLMTQVSRRQLEATFAEEAQKIAFDWSELSDQRNNLAHAWGFSDEDQVSLLGGYSHEFKRDGQHIRTRMVWSLEELRRMTADCHRIFGRIRAWREAYEKLKH